MGKVANRAIRDQRSEKWHTHAHTTTRPPRELRATHPLHTGSWRHRATAQGGSCCHRATGTCSAQEGAAATGRQRKNGAGAAGARAGRGRLPSGTYGARWELALQGNRTWWELLPPGTRHQPRPGGSARMEPGAGATGQPRRVGAAATRHGAPTAHRRELLPPSGSARKELEHAGLGLGNAHIKDEARGSRLGPDCTGDKTRGPELGLRPARTGDEAMANRLGVGSARIGDETRGLGHGPGPARIGDKRRGLGLGFVLALLVLRTRRRAVGASVLPSRPLARPSEQVVILRCATCAKS